MVEDFEIILDPILRYSSTLNRKPENLPDVPECLERVTEIGLGDIIYQRAPSQNRTRITHSFYPGSIKIVDEIVSFVTLTKMPSYPPGFGLDHQPGTALPLSWLDQGQFFRKVA